MSAPARSLNSRISHPKLLDLLGCTVRTQSLPQLTICPMCRQGGMQILIDHVDGGAWYHCQACNRSGDLIELAAEVWKLEVPQAIMYLASKGFDAPTDEKAINRYLREHVDYRQRLNQLWVEAQRGLIASSYPLMRVVSRLRLDWSHSDRWHEGPGQRGYDRDRTPHALSRGVPLHSTM